MLLLWTVLVVTASGLALPSSTEKFAKRVTPSRTYAPSHVDCPAGQLVRNASTLSVEETKYIQARKTITRPILRQFLSTTKLTDVDALFKRGFVPNLGLAFSGGGYRAMIDGGGRLNAFDWRNEKANGTGQLGGLFQGANYITGLSGGAWLVGGLAINGNPQVFDTWHKTWQLDESILNPGGLNVLQTAEYYKDIVSQVGDKKQADFKVTITDVWGRALSQHLIDETMHGEAGGPSTTWTDIVTRLSFVKQTVPFPIIIADQRSPGALAIATNTSNYEFNPYEFGSFDASVFAFTPMKYIGSKLRNGVPVTKKKCVAGFDSASFALATSSSVFNAAMTKLSGTSLKNDVFGKILTDLSKDELDIASYPNPFFGMKGIQGSESPELTLVDGGMDGQNIALNPLLQPVRQVDVIIASDSSADTENHWPNGTSLITAYERYKSVKGNSTSFVHVPDAQTFVNLGLNARPTFFGCDGKNVTRGVNIAPLIIYLPNAPISSLSNYSTYTMQYSDAQTAAILENGWNVATRANGTLDSAWPTCLACAVTQRSREAAGLPVPSECQACFSRYCWDGRIDSTPKKYNPVLQIQPTIVKPSCGFFDRFFRRNRC